jgi:hypothetical protein
MHNLGAGINLVFSSIEPMMITGNFNHKNIIQLFDFVNLGIRLIFEI